MSALKTVEEAIAFCLTWPDVYQDYPFPRSPMCVIRHRENRKIFAWVFLHEGRTWINVKCEPEQIWFWRSVYPSVVPAWHLNKDHWNSLILDGSISERDLKMMINESYRLTMDRKGRKKDE